MSSTLLHLVYVHGFNGDHTTFQAFPTDLQEYVSANIPPHLNMRVQSSLYPTYKSVRPISHAAQNFLEWLATQPPGPVILLGHSMGGLLVAEAAIHPSNNPDKFPGARPRRIIGMMAFDCPYLGMHPHVVISGIASLFAKDEATHKTESELNREHPEVRIIDEKVTDDWESFKNNLDSKRLTPTNSHSNLSITRTHSRESSASGSSYLTAPASPTSPSSTKSTKSSYLTAQSLTTSLGLPPSPIVDKAMSFISTHSDDPLVRWFRKHSDEPLTASKRWIVEHFQFGSCMFDPVGLRDRYKLLVAWQGGLWVNYWTQTIPRPKTPNKVVGESEQGIQAPEQVMANDIALIESGVAPTPSTSTSMSEEVTIEIEPPTLGPPTKSEAKAADKAVQKAAKVEQKERQKAEKEREKQLKKLQKRREAENKERPGRHFIVLPTGLGAVLGGGDNWEKVLIAGVEDEVAAHCGVFIKNQNLDYDAFVERVGRRVFDWCERI